MAQAKPFVSTIFEGFFLLAHLARPGGRSIYITYSVKRCCLFRSSHPTRRVGAVELSRSHVMACVSERTAITGGEEDYPSIRRCHKSFARNTNDHNSFFFRSAVPTARFFSHCSKTMIRMSFVWCVNRSEVQSAKQLDSDSRIGSV